MPKQASPTASSATRPGSAVAPNDWTTCVGSRRTGFRVGIVRAALESSALLVGFALGGHVGIGTVVFALLIGPSVEASFFLVDRFGLSSVQVPAPSEASVS